MDINRYLDKIRDTESTEAYFWAVETAYQLDAISADEHTKRMAEYTKLEAEHTVKLLEKIK